LAERPSTAHEEQRDESATGRVDAAFRDRKHRDAAAGAGMLSRPSTLRRSQENGHLIERHAAARLVQNSADDFHRFAGFRPAPKTG
jgi:hypothetical protein